MANHGDGIALIDVVHHSAHAALEHLRNGKAIKPAVRSIAAKDPLPVKRVIGAYIISKECGGT